MLIKQENGKYLTGPLDVVLILGDVNTKRLHVALFEEVPMPGPVPSVQDMNFVRLKSKMHHTSGAEDWETAQQQMKDLLNTFQVPETNVMRDVVYLWDGTVGLTVIANNWIQTKGKVLIASLPFVPPTGFLEGVSVLK